jgi:hypothetical protein
MSFFGPMGVIDGLLNFGTLFVIQLKVYASAHADQFSSFVDDFRFLA